MTDSEASGEPDGLLPSRWAAVLRHGPRNRPLWYLWRLVCGVAVGGLFAWMYFGISRVTLDRSYSLLTRLDAAIPFIPWTWWIYFPGYLLGLLIAVLALRDMRIFYRILVTVLFADLVCVAIFFVFPSTFPRPTNPGPGLTGEAIRWFWSIDPPNNTFPSSHVAMSVLAALAMWKDKNRLRLANYLLTTGVAVTVLTTKQHYLLDVLGGFVVAFGSFRLVFHLWPLERPKAGEVEVMAIAPNAPTGSTPIS